MARLARQCLVRLTVRTDTPRIRLLRSLHCAAAHGSVIDSVLAARHCRRVRGRIQLAALVSGIVVPPQPDPDVTQARCSSRRMPRNAVAHLDTLADFALLALHCVHCTAQCSRCARGYRCCSPLTHSFRCRRSTLPCLRFTAHRHRHSTKSSLELSSRPDFVEKSSTHSRT